MIKEKTKEKIRKLDEKIKKLDEKIRLAKEEQKECYKKIEELENEEKLNLLGDMSIEEIAKLLNHNNETDTEKAEEIKNENA